MKEKQISMDYFKKALKYILTDFYEIWELDGFKRATKEEAISLIDTMDYKLIYAEPEILLKDLIDCNSNIESKKRHYKLLIQVRRELGTNYILEMYKRYGNNDLSKSKKEEEKMTNENINKYCKNVYTNKTKEELDTYKLNTDLIKRLLKANSITQKEFGVLLGISIKSVERKLNEETEFKADELIKIIKMFNLELEDIIYKKNVKK